jgi:hypothetical protein
MVKVEAMTKINNSKSSIILSAAWLGASINIADRYWAKIITRML